MKLTRTLTALLALLLLVGNLTACTSPPEDPTQAGTSADSSPETYAQEPPENSLYTRAPRRSGTPRYMSTARKATRPTNTAG